ncbi:YbaK/EbsC family protein [Streptomyces sp. NBC_01171]|uniref:YbaK/EbsC family protein n=1 Tax=Streptomyces sp. NBC_01171 TaxID=2903757 RepID=UPI003870E4E4
MAAIASSLLFSVDGDALLVLTSGAHRVDTRRVTGRVGVARTRIRRADPVFVLTATGQDVGGVAPAGHPQPVRTLIDATGGRVRAPLGGRRDAAHGVPGDVPVAGTDHRREAGGGRGGTGVGRPTPRSRPPRRAPRCGGCAGRPGVGRGW